MANLLRGDSKVLLVACFLWGVKFWKRSSIAESDNRLKLNDWTIPKPIVKSACHFKGVIPSGSGAASDSDEGKA
jgi:hypothetical protein